MPVPTKKRLLPVSDAESGYHRFVKTLTNKKLKLKPFVNLASTSPFDERVFELGIRLDDDNVTPDKILFRNCYSEYLQREILPVLLRKGKVFIGGAKGIGKSVLTTLTALTLFQMGYVVVLEHHRKRLLLLKSSIQPEVVEACQECLERHDFQRIPLSSTETVYEIDDVQLFEHLRMIESVILIQDIGDSPESSLNIDGNTARMWVSSPNAERIRGALRHPSYVSLYLPRWSFEEVKYAAEKIFQSNLSETELMERYDKFGGIPRYVFDTSGKSDKLLKTAIASATLDQLRMVFQSPYFDIPKDFLGGILIHPVPSDNDIHTSINVPASQKTMNDLFDSLRLRLSLQSAEFANVISGVPELRVYYGRYLEAQMHDLLFRSPDA